MIGVKTEKHSSEDPPAFSWYYVVLPNILIINSNTMQNEQSHATGDVVDVFSFFFS